MIFRQVHQTTAKLIWRVRDQMYPHAYVLHLEGAFFPVSLYDEPLSSYSIILTKMHLLTPKMTWTCLRSEVPMYICTSYANKPNSFVQAVFQSWPNIEDSTLNNPKSDLDMFNVKVPILCLLHTPRRPKFSSVSLYDEPFSRNRDFWISQLSAMWKWIF